MVNKTGGRSYKKNKRKIEVKKITPYVDNDNTLRYGQVQKKVGGNRIAVLCSDRIERQAVIPGSFYKRVWLNSGDIVLVQISELNKDDSYVLYKYNSNEIH